MRKLIPCLLAALICLPGMAAPEAARAADAEYVLSLNLPIPPIHNRWNHALKPWIAELETRFSNVETDIVVPSLWKK